MSRNIGRPVPLFSQVEGKILDFQIWKRRAQSDGIVTPAEAAEGIALAESLVADAGLLAVSCRHVATVLGGERGIDSYRAVRDWNERRRATPGTVIQFPGDDTGDPEAA